jgi:hypothetical protein
LCRRKPFAVIPGIYGSEFVCGRINEVSELAHHLASLSSRKMRPRAFECCPSRFDSIVNVYLAAGVDSDNLIFVTGLYQ